MISDREGQIVMRLEEVNIKGNPLQWLNKGRAVVNIHYENGCT